MKSRIKAGIAGGLALFVALSIVLNLYLYRLARSYYVQLNQTRLDPLGLDQYPDEDLSGIHALPVVVFFGDSRAYQWPDPEMEDLYHFVNRGIGSQTSAQVAARFDRHVRPIQPDIIILQVGINDLKTIPLFPNQGQEIISLCETNIKKIVDDSLELGAMVVLTTVVPPGEIPFERRFVWSEDVALAVDEVNRFLYSLAGERVVILDTGKLLTDAEGVVQREYSQDFLHLNAAGYQALNEELESVLEKIYK